MDIVEIEQIWQMKESSFLNGEKLAVASHLCAPVVCVCKNTDQKPLLYFYTYSARPHLIMILALDMQRLSDEPRNGKLCWFRRESNKCHKYCTWKVLVSGPLNAFHAWVPIHRRVIRRKRFRNRRHKHLTFTCNNWKNFI